MAFLSSSREEGLPDAEQRWGRVEVALGGLSAALRRAAIPGADEASPVMLSALFALVQRYTGVDDLIIGWEEPGRFAVIRERVEPTSTFPALLHRVRSDWAEDWAWGGDEARSCIHALVGADAVPISFTPHTPATVGGHVRPGVELLVSLQEDPAGRATCVLDFDRERLAEGFVQQIGGQLVRIAAAGLESPETGLQRLPLLSLEERRRILEDFSGATVLGPAPTCVHAVFAVQAARTPDAVAVRAGSVSLTYRELERRANAMAHALAARGVGPHQRVALLLERSVEMLAALLGVLKIGGAYVPLDPELPAERLGYILEEGGLRAILTRRCHLETLPLDGVGTRVLLDELIEEVEQGRDEPPPAKVTPEHAAYIIYTSGSSGRPKGVVVAHRGVYGMVLGHQEVMGERCNLLQFYSFAFDASVFEIFSALLTGGTLVLESRDMLLQSEALAQLIRRHDITSLQLPPSVLSLLPLEDYPSLRVVFVGGEVYPPELVARWGARFPVVNVYGPTEATVCTTWHRREHAELRLPIGRPLPGARVYVLDELLQPVPPGVLGEIFIGGVGLACGYAENPRLTAEKFVCDPVSGVPGARLYQTGDRGRWRPDGRLEFVGRVDSQVKVRGYRVEPAEVERALEGHAAVREAAVVARRDPQGELRLVAYVLPMLEPPPTRELVAELRHHLGARLPRFMLPAVITFLAELPRTANLKLDRNALPTPEWGSGADEKGKALLGALERRVAEVWASVLGGGMPGPDDAFLALGGDSVGAMRMTARLRQALRVPLEVSEVFSFGTVRRMAELLASRVSREVESLPTRVVQALLEEKGLEPGGEPRGTLRDACLAGNARLPNDCGELSIQGRAREGSLSYAQQRMWLLDQQEPGSPTYNLAWSYRIHGPLDEDALVNGVAELVRRHEVLRTRFVVRGDEPMQEVLPPRAEPPVARVDLTLPSVAEAERARLVRRMAEGPYDLASGELFRAVLVRFGAEDHELILGAHHSVADGWSVGILSRELGALYLDFSRGRAPSLRLLDVQHLDFTAWHARFLQRPEVRAQLDFWKKTLSGEIPVLALPTDRPRPRQRAVEGRRTAFRVPADLVTRLQQVGLRHSASLYMVLLAAYKVLLHRLTREQDILVGTPVANRNRPELENLFGFLVNTLVLRNHVSGEQRFEELLQSVQRTALAAYDNQDVPFERLVQEICPDRTLSHTPLFQVFFVFQTLAMPPLSIPGAETRIEEIPNGTAKFDLHLELVETASGLRGWFEYRMDIYDASTVAALARRYVRVLEGIAAHPDEKVRRLPLLLPEDHEMLARFNDTRVPRFLGGSLFALIRERAAAHPEAIAVIFEDEELTYVELLRRAARVAGELRARGVRTGDRVGLFLERSVETLIGAVAVIQAGAAFVPADVDYPEARWRYLLEDSGVPVILTHARLLPRLAGMQAACMAMDGDMGSAVSFPVDGPLAAGPEDAAYIIYTSGSTGRPKGAINTHEGIVNRLLWMQDTLRLEPGERVIHKTPCGFDVSVWELFWPLLAGATVVVARPMGEKDPAYLAELIRRREVSTLHFVPSMLQLFVLEPTAARCTSLRRIVCSGEELPAELARRALATLRGRLYNLYGPTEAAIDVTWWTCEEGQSGASVPIGRPVANTQIHVVDAEGLPVPVGTPGEICIGGVNVGRGYLNRPELTAERFVPDPFSDRPLARLYRTGDLGRWTPAGAVEFLGRLDFQVKLRGVRIELGEIEAALVAHPLVREAVACVQSAAGGESKLVAFVVLRESAQAPEDWREQVRTALRASLPDAMVPNAFVALEAIPLTPNGKADRGTLCNRRVEDEGTRVVDLMEPRTPMELEVRRLWREVLGVERIGLHDDFFTLGGHSLLATRLVMRLREHFKVDLPVRSLFESRTVKGVARDIDVLRQVGSITLPGEGSVDLVREAQLEPAPQPAWTGGDLRPRPARVLVTGATGFLGAYLLDELSKRTEAELVCLVRAADDAAASERVRRNLETHGLWRPELAGRLFALASDLGSPDLGLGKESWGSLARTVDIIYHGGAWVNFIEPYRRLKPANVDGTKALLRLAREGRPKSLHYIGSSSVYGTVGYFTGRRLLNEDEPIELGLGYGFGGYVQSKWVAEQMVWEAIRQGVPASVYRCALVMGHSRTGQTNVRDFPSMLIKGCIQRKSFYTLKNKYDNFVPVDFASESIVHLSLRRESLGKAFHVVNPHHLEYSEFFGLIAAMGYRLDPVPFRDWLSAFLRDIRETERNAIFPVIPLFVEKVSAARRSIVELFEETPIYSTKNVDEGLRDSGIRCPPIDAKLVGAWMDYYVRTGFIPAPDGVLLGEAGPEPGWAPRGHT